ncbi:MAG: hypothetical protein ACYDHX_12165 [Methanothrix sp.]
MEASKMKKYLVMLVAMLALVSFGAATYTPPSCWPNCGQTDLCTDGVCDYNVITQDNTAQATSGQAFVCDGCGLQLAPGYLNVEQTQTNCAAVLGEGNIVNQNNKADAYGSAMKQTQSNVAMVVGSSNFVDQDNTGMETGTPADGAYGIYETQDQKNLMLIIGVNNHAEQSNDAKAYSDSKIFPAYPISQTQKNVGLLLGKKNWLVQGNDATATMQKFIEVDPAIKQMQKNIAFAVNNCADCVVDTSFAGTTSFTWPAVTAPAPAIPAIACPTGDC